MRIVDIDAGVAPSTTVAESEAALSDHDVAPRTSHTRSISHGSPGKSHQQRALGHGRSATEASRASPQRAKVSASTFDAPVPKLGDDAFRKRIEALRNEVGTNWLAALGESDLSGSDAKSATAAAKPGRKLGPSSPPPPSDNV